MSGSTATNLRAHAVNRDGKVLGMFDYLTDGKEAIAIADALDLLHELLLADFLSDEHAETAKRVLDVLGMET